MRLCVSWGIVLVVMTLLPQPIVADRTPKAPSKPGPHPAVRTVYAEEWRPWKRDGGSVAKAARRGGWYVIVHGAAGEGFGRVDRIEAREAAEIRSAARQMGRRVGLLTRWRADVVGCDRGVGCDREGFDPNWLRVVSSEHQAAKDLRRWREASYRLRPSDRMDPAWWERITASLDEGQHLIPYVRIHKGEQRLEVRKVAADLCNAQYRNWAADHAAWQVSKVGADGIVLSNKYVYWPRPQVWHDKPARIWLGGGVITDTPYERGEYERCFAELIRELRKRQIRVVLNTNGLRRPEAWRWMPSDLPKLVLGEVRPASFRKRDGPAARSAVKAQDILGAAPAPAGSGDE